MLAHTKKRHTKKIVLTFTGPVSQKDKAKELMEAIRFKDNIGSETVAGIFSGFADFKPALKQTGIFIDRFFYKALKKINFRIQIIRGAPKNPDIEPPSSRLGSGTSEPL